MYLQIDCLHGMALCATAWSKVRIKEVLTRHQHTNQSASRARTLLSAVLDDTHAYAKPSCAGTPRFHGRA